MDTCESVFQYPLRIERGCKTFPQAVTAYDLQLSVSPADRAWVQADSHAYTVAENCPFQYPLRIERGCKERSGWATVRCGNFQYPLRIERGCKGFSKDWVAEAWAPFSIPCGSSVGARKIAQEDGQRLQKLSVSPADRAWVQARCVLS